MPGRSVVDQIRAKALRAVQGILRLPRTPSDTTGQSSAYEHGCKKWLTESRGVKYAEQGVKNCFSNEIVTVEFLGDQGVTTLTAFWGSKEPSSDRSRPG